MRFMVMHKVDANMEAGGPPSPQIVQSMGALVQQSLKEGTFTTGAGLHRSARRARLEPAGGSVRVTQGPYSGKNELLSSFAMIRAGSLEEAIERARELSRVLGDAEVEVGPVVEPWDIGVMPRPEGATNNVEDEYIANVPKDCSGNYMQLSVEPDGASYTVKVPANKHARTFKTRG